MGFLLHDVHDVSRLCALPYFADHDRESFDMFMDSTRGLARSELFKTYKPMDEEPPSFEGGRICVHPLMHALYPKLVDLGLLSAGRPYAVGGAQVPQAVVTMALMYPMAANLSALSYLFLTTGAAHLIESFGSHELKANFMEKMYAGTWTGTMALTESGAGSSLADIRTTAAPADDGTYRIRGTKIFISGGDNDLVENIVHLTLARIPGGPAGIRGISLFAVPRLRPDADGTLVDNDVATSQAIHKIGWRGLPSLALSYGDNDQCHGWLVGEPHRGLSYMFQMMNEARILVGAHGVATASVAYQQSLIYARERTQGRHATAKDPAQPMIPIIEHADVRRMLLRQKAIVEGGLSLVIEASALADLTAHSQDADQKRESQILLDLLTPVVKTFPAEWGFESNTLALQIHGGYGYSSEYLPEAWLRDQKLNSIHEGTTGIHGLDLLGRKAMAGGGKGLRLLAREIHRTAEAADAAGVAPGQGKALVAAMARLGEVTAALGAKGAQGDVTAMLAHSTDYLYAASIIVVGWQWLKMAAVAGNKPDAFHAGKRAAASYWHATELPRALHHLELAATVEDSYLKISPDSF